MPLFISSVAQANYPGVFAVDVKAPTVIEGISLGKVGYVGQFAWGPHNEVYEPTSAANFLDTYEPAGSPRTSTGYYGLMRRKRMALAIYRPLGSGSAAADLQIAGTGGDVLAEAKYHGTLGNSLVGNLSAAGGGDTTKRKITISLTDAVTGSTTEIYDNVAFGDEVDVSSSKLIDSLSVESAMSVWPANGDTSFSGGLDGAAIAASDYDGGFTDFDTIDDILVYVTDDCGDTIRDAVNAFIQDHVDAKTDRIGIVQGSSANDWSDVKTDVASYRSKYIRYSAGWSYVFDDGGALRLTPESTFMASAMTNLEPQQSDAWWDARATTYYDGIDSLYTPEWSRSDESVKADAMAYGIGFVVRLPDGRFAGLLDRNTNLAVADRYMVTTRLRIYLMKSIVAQITSWVNGPNALTEQQDLLMALRGYFGTEKDRRRIIDFSLSTDGLNSQASQAAGQFIVAIAVTTPAPMERIILLAQIGPTVTITQLAA